MIMSTNHLGICHLHIHTENKLQHGSTQVSLQNKTHFEINAALRDSVSNYIPK